MKTTALNPDTLIWNLVTLTGGTSAEKAKAKRKLESAGYSKFNKFIYARVCADQESADKFADCIKGLVSYDLIQMTDTQFGKIVRNA